MNKIRLASVIQTLIDEGDGLLPKFTSLGGYPLYYQDKQGNTICPDCAQNEIEAMQTLGEDYIDIGELPSHFGINYENPELFCDACSERIESAYCEDEKLSENSPIV